MKTERDRSGEEQLEKSDKKKVEKERKIKRETSREQGLTVDLL